MSEVVVRMEMPTENTTCELNCYSNFYREWRCIIKDKRCDHNKNGMFPSWCPIICPLPEGHGRLVDADELRREMYHEAFETDTNMQKWDSGCWIRYKMFENTIGAVPTIVPAEAERSET